MKIGVLTGSLALVMLGAQSVQLGCAQQAIPDAPKPQAPALPNLGSVAPGQGTTSTSAGDRPSDVPAAPSAGPATAVAPAATNQPPIYQPPVGQGQDAVKTIIVRVNEVDVEFTVKDMKGRLVPGLTGRDVQVYENGVQQHIDLFTSDARPMSVAIVIDQSMTRDQMDRVNIALGALQDAFTKYDEITVYTYNKSIKQQTDFTGAQSARLTQTIERSKGTGRDVILAGSLEGPMAQTTVINDMNVDPNTASQHGHTGMTMDIPREVHPLNDAILAAATALSTRPVERRRVIYVISNGNEYGSAAKEGQVIKYLQRNAVEVDATLVGDTAIWGMGVLDRIHLPLMMRDNALPPYVNQTGGNIDSEFRIEQIEKSFARIAEEARTRYTILYTTHEPFLDDKYRKWEIKVLKPDLTVIAPPGYWPAAKELHPRAAVPLP